MRFPLRSFALLAAIVIPVAAHADTFTGTAGFTDSNPGGQIDFTGVFNTPGFTFTGTTGYVYNDQLTITSSTTRNGNASVNETDALTVTLLFTLPNPSSGSITGSGTITGHVNSAADTITWDNGGTSLINFSDGSVLQASLANFSFSGFTSDSENLALTVETNGSLSAVPEPASLALLGTGLLGAVGIIRRKLSA